MFRFDEFLSLGVATFTCSGLVGVAVGTLGNAPRAVVVASVLFLVLAAGLGLLRNHLRRRARAELMSWLPQTHRIHRPSRNKNGWGSDWEGLWSTDEASVEDASAGLQMARPDTRDTTTRAVLASFRQAMKVEALAVRTERPECRRARMRALGRDSSGSRSSSRRRMPSPRSRSFS